MKVLSLLGICTNSHESGEEFEQKHAKFAKKTLRRRSGQGECFTIFAGSRKGGIQQKS